MSFTNLHLTSCFINTLKHLKYKCWLTSDIQNLGTLKVPKCDKCIKPRRSVHYEKWIK